jgi:AcrR family transcriptional regulator
MAPEHGGVPSAAGTPRDAAPPDTPSRPDAADRVALRRQATRELILAAAWDLARETGVTGFTLRELAERVGMRAPSLYEYFTSKDAIHDAMFAQGNRAFLAMVTDLADEHLPLIAQPCASAPSRHQVRELLTAAADAYLDFATADPVRFQLLFQHASTGWQPSTAAYAPAQAAYEVLRGAFAAFGVTDQRSLDLWTALTSGLAHQQLANDPGGRRWHDLVDDAVDLYLHHLELHDLDQHHPDTRS